MYKKKAKRLQRNPEMVHTNTGQELVIMSLENGEYYGLNEVGSTIWTLLDNALSPEEVVNKLADIYDISIEQCTVETNDFINAMLDKNILLQD